MENEKELNDFEQTQVQNENIYEAPSPVEEAAMNDATVVVASSES